MASIFSRLEQRVSNAVDRVYGEAMALVPKEVGEFASTADPDRNCYEFVAVVDFTPQIGVQVNSGTRMNDFASISGDEIHVSIKVTALPADRALWPKQGDTIILTDRPEEPGLRISNVEPDGIGRVVCRCSRTPL